MGYQEILEKGSFPEIKENIVKIEKTISNEKIKEKVTNEKKAGTNIKEDRSPNIWQRNKEDTKKPEVTNLKDRVPDFWHRRKVDTKKQEQKQNKMENSECEHCNKEFVSKERLRVHKSVCEKKTFMRIEPRKIEKVIKIKNTEDNIEDVIIKNDKKISQESRRKTNEGIELVK